MSASVAHDQTLVTVVAPRGQLSADGHHLGRDNLDSVPPLPVAWTSPGHESDSSNTPVLEGGGTASPVSDETFWRLGVQGVIGGHRHAAALVCQQGHVLNSNILQRPRGDLGYCDIGGRCGAKVFGECPTCGVRISGDEYEQCSESLTGWRRLRILHPLAFCDGCGYPQPWATKDERCRQLKQLVESQQLEDYDREQALRAIDLLSREGLTEKKRLRLWRKLLEHAPGLIASGERIAESLATAYFKRLFNI